METETTVKKRNYFTPKDAAAAFFFAAVGTIAFQFAAGIALYAALGADRADELLKTDFTVNVVVMTLNQFVIAGAFLLVSLRGKTDFVTAGRIKPAKPPAYGYGVVLSLAALAGFALTAALAEYVFSLAGYNAPASPLVFNGAGRYAAGALAVCLLPAVAEELLFRGVVFNGLLHLGKRRAVLLSAAAFALMHMSPSQTVYQFLLGIVLGLAAAETGSLTVCSAIHFLNNLAAITMDFAGFDPFGDISGGALCGGAALTLVVGAAVIVGATFLYRRYFARRDPVSEPPNYEKITFKKAVFAEKNTFGFMLAAVIAAATMWLAAFFS